MLIAENPLLNTDYFKYNYPLLDRDCSLNISIFLLKTTTMNNLCSQEYSDSFHFIEGPIFDAKYFDSKLRTETE